MGTSTPGTYSAAQLQTRADILHDMAGDIGAVADAMVAKKILPMVIKPITGTENAMKDALPKFVAGAKRALHDALRDRGTQQGNSKAATTKRTKAKSRAK